MKKIILVTFAIISLALSQANSVQLNTPESFTQKITFQPFITQVIENKNLKEALKQLDELNIKMTEDGWTLFQMIEYIDSGNFKGFIATYKKVDEKENSK